MDKSALNTISNFLLKEREHNFYFALFRVFVCLFLIKDIFVKWSFMDILYRGNSFLVPSESGILELVNLSTTSLRNNIEYFILVHVMLIILFFFGIGKHLVAFFVFVTYELSQRLCHITLNGGDNLLKFAILYLIFADSYNYFSITRLSIKSELGKKNNDLLTNLARLSICFHLCLAYFLSALHKIHADVWFNGIATYYTLSLERFQGTSFNLALAKNGLFVTVSTYFTILVELLFPVLVWSKSLKWLMLTLGVMLHMGIFIFMMIYDFQIVFISIYGFFISDAEWGKVMNFLKRRRFFPRWGIDAKTN